MRKKKVVYDIGSVPFDKDTLQRNAEKLLACDYKAPDLVNHPEHYTSGGVECIDAIKASMSEESFKGFLKGNVQKYLWRYEKKVAPKQDLEKAEFYLKRLIKEME